jgi:serine phosphatase RsbU (regulator of sigma subunit)
MATGDRERSSDRSESRTAEDASRWEALLDGSTYPAALWSGADMQFTWANRRFLEMLWESQSRFDLLGMPMRGFLSDTESAIHFQDAAYTGQPYTEPEYGYRAPSGADTYWQLTFLPVRARLGDPYDVLVTAVDVTAEVLQRRNTERTTADLAAAEGLIQRTILSTLDADEILQRALIEATEAYGADWGWIALKELDSWVFRNVHGWPAEIIGRSFRVDELSLPSLAADAHEVVLAPSRDAAGERTAQLMEGHDIGAFVLVPLYAKGEVRGVMGFCWNDAEPLGEPHRELGEKLSLALTLGLENARTYGNERYIARTLQSAFFTVPRRVDGIEFGHLYHAANIGARVGGDFYDILEPAPGQVALLIGDIAGHGIGVSALASLVKSSMHIHALQSPSPCQVLAATNELVSRSVLTDAYVSAFFGLMDTSTGAFAYCSAGHPQPVVAKAGASARLLRDPQMVLGVEQGVPYANRAASLDLGDLLVLYTDGLIEARDAEGRRYGTERLLHAVEHCAEAPAAAIPETLFLDAFSFAEGELADDIAVLAVRRTEPPAEGGNLQDRLALEVG